MENIRKKIKLNKKNEFDVISIGSNAVDAICVLPQFPEYNKKLRMNDFEIDGGGQASTAAVACSKLGLKTRYIGKVGDDIFGRYAIERLIAENVDVEGVLVKQNAKTQFAVIMLEKNIGERTIIWNRDDALELLASDLDKDIICSGKVLLIGNSHPLATKQAIEWAEKEDMLIVMDAERVEEHTKDILPHVDVLIGDSEFCKLISQEKDDKEALIKTKDLGPKIVGSTLGENGSIFYDGNNFYTSKAFNINTIDTTGAGDVFHAAFIRALFEDWNLQKTSDFSNAVAAIKCTDLGGRKAIPGFNEALKFLSENI
ncbi:MAG: carbohydrate kinase family protein [Pseudomonadota bacterium]